MQNTINNTVLYISEHSFLSQFL